MHTSIATENNVNVTPSSSNQPGGSPSSYDIAFLFTMAIVPFCISGLDRLRTPINIHTHIQSAMCSVDSLRIKK